MSDLSATATSRSASASATGLLASLRSSTANSPSANSPTASGDAPNFSSVLKERADKLTKPEGAPAEKAGKAQEQRETAAEASEAASTAAEAATDAATRSERTARGEKRGESSADKHDEESTAQEALADDIDNTPIAAVMVQMTPSALVAANADAIESGVIADGKSPFGAVVRELARGHGQDAKGDAGNHGLALALGQGTGKDGVSAGDLTDGGQAGDPSAGGEQPLLIAGTESELAATGTATTETPEALALALTASDEEAELIASAPTGKASSTASDFNQLLTQVRDGQSAGAGGGVGGAGRTGGSDAAMAMRSPVGHPNWSNELGDKMTWMVSSQRQQAELVLNPPQLGRIEVSLTVNGDQANAVFTSPNAAVREMLENSLPRLREILAGSGLNLGQADVGAQAFAQQQGQDGQRQASGMRGDRGAELDSAISAGGAVNLGRAGERRGMVDIFA